MSEVYIRVFVHRDEPRTEMKADSYIFPQQLHPDRPATDTFDKDLFMKDVMAAIVGALNQELDEETNDHI